jgi:D-amino-acid dehydrogenase
MDNLKSYLVKQGVQIIPEQEVLELSCSNDRVSKVKVQGGDYTPDEVVLTAGAWTKKLCKQLGIKILLEAGKGYCIDSYRPLNIRYPAIIAEPKVAITPMNGYTRFAGTMEFSGINGFIRKERVQAIADAVKRVYPEIELTKQEKEMATSGLRPVSPDGLPFIGKSEKCKNLTIATGHAMMGWTFGPGTGKLVNEIINGDQPSIGLDLFAPDRKF